MTQRSTTGTRAGRRSRSRRRNLAAPGDTPNGLTESLVVEAARLLGERGLTELSLNFSVCGRWLREPANVVERALAVVLRRADKHFQVERLLKFNAKLDPRSQPRYLLFECPAQLPRIALATMWAEGQLPRLSLPLASAPASPLGAYSAR